jgi:hypothetical protein
MGCDHDFGNAELWWESARERSHELDSPAAKNFIDSFDDEVTLPANEADALLEWAARLPGYSDGPEYAPVPLIETELDETMLAIEWDWHLAHECHSIEDVVTYIKANICEAAQLAGQYAENCAANAGYGTDKVNLEGHLEILKDAGAKFDHSDALKAAVYFAEKS